MTKTFNCPKCGKELYAIEGYLKYKNDYLNYWFECPKVPTENMFGCASMYEIKWLSEENYDIGEEIVR